MTRSSLWGCVATSSAVSLILALVPLHPTVMYFRPEIVALIAIYWVITVPFSVGMVYAWALGLVVDIAEGAVLGQNALALAIIAYIAGVLHQRFRMFSLWQQTLSVFLLVVIHQFINHWVQSISGNRTDSMAFLLPAIPSALLWPLIPALLGRFIRAWPT